MIKEKITRKIKKGYVWIYAPDHKYSKTKKGWIWEHRLVCENFIGKALKGGNVVHHFDENKENNKISNLMIFRGQKEHSSWHNKLKRYGYLTKPMLREIANRWREYKNV